MASYSGCDQTMIVCLTDQELHVMLRAHLNIKDISLPDDYILKIVCDKDHTKLHHLYKDVMEIKIYRKIS